MLQIACFGCFKNLLVSDGLWPSHLRPPKKLNTQSVAKLNPAALDTTTTLATSDFAGE